MRDDVKDTPTAPPARPALGMRLGRLPRLMRKELAEILRDRRTILTLVLMPLLLYPLIGIGFQQYLISRQALAGEVVYRLGFRNRAEATFLLTYLEIGRQVLATEGAWQPVTTDPETAGTQVAPVPKLAASTGTDMEPSLMDGHIDVALRPRGPLPRRPDQSLDIDWETIYRVDSASGHEAVQYLQRLCSAANRRYLSERLGAAGQEQRPAPVLLIPEARTEIGPKKPTLLAAVVPLILIMMTITGAVYPAIDLTAGERERGTLEVLVAAPIPRLSVLFAKYVAVLTVATLTAAVNLTTMLVTLGVTGMGAALLGNQDLGWVRLAEVFGLLLLFAAFFSAVLLALTSFARSFKEAQAYLIPLMLAALTPGMIGVMPGVELKGFLVVVPLVNVVLLARDLIAGHVAAFTATVVVVTTLLYALAALAVAARVFGAEAVLYSQTSAWSDLFRQPAEASDAPRPSAALLTLAFMFPALFLIVNGQARLGHLSVAGTLLVNVLATLVLFVGFPGVSLWLGRVRMRPALALTWPRWQGCAAALLLGLSLWPLVHEIDALLRDAGLTTLKGEMLDRVKQELDRWRKVSPLALLAVIAVLTPIVEELFYRGYLFGALLRDLRPTAVICVTAGLFGLFHLFLQGGLMLEKILPTALMGLVLGWVRWRTGSVIPGILLHVAHNGVIVLLAYYQPWLEAAHVVPPGDAHLPWTYVAAAFGVAGLGAMWMWSATKAPKSFREGET
jgi:ABC-2 type transport system permease protein/sodium transport system permease protein